MILYKYAFIVSLARNKCLGINSSDAYIKKMCIICYISQYMNGFYTIECIGTAVFHFLHF